MAFVYLRCDLYKSPLLMTPWREAKASGPSPTADRRTAPQPHDDVLINNPKHAASPTATVSGQEVTEGRGRTKWRLWLIQCMEAGLILSNTDGSTSDRSKHAEFKAQIKQQASFSLVHDAGTWTEVTGAFHERSKQKALTENEKNTVTGPTLFYFPGSIVFLTQWWLITDFCSYFDSK